MPSYGSPLSAGWTPFPIGSDDTCYYGPVVEAMMDDSRNLKLRKVRRPACAAAHGGTARAADSGDR
jgi:hypothetical protein